MLIELFVKPLNFFNTFFFFAAANFATVVISASMNTPHLTFLLNAAQNLEPSYPSCVHHHTSHRPLPGTMSEPKEDESSTASPPPFPLDDEQQEQSGEANTLYKYRDFSTMPEEQDAEEDNSPSKQGSLESSIRVQKFPVKLYAILAQKEFHDIISWMPHGRSWKVLKPNLFESMVMPLFFEYSNYHSFNRLVNAWSFRRISSGPDRGSYYHEVGFLVHVLYLFAYCIYLFLCC